MERCGGADSGQQSTYGGAQRQCWSRAADRLAPTPLLRRTGTPAPPTAPATCLSQPTDTHTSYTQEQRTKRSDKRSDATADGTDRGWLLFEGPAPLTAAARGPNGGARGSAQRLFEGPAPCTAAARGPNEHLEGTVRLCTLRLRHELRQAKAAVRPCVFLSRI